MFLVMVEKCALATAVAQWEGNLMNQKEVVSPFLSKATSRDHSPRTELKSAQRRTANVDDHRSGKYDSDLPLFKVWRFGVYLPECAHVVLYLCILWCLCSLLSKLWGWIVSFHKGLLFGERCGHGRQFGLKCAGERDAFGSAFSEGLGTIRMHSFFSL